jgi:lipoprotein NlpD
MPPAVQAKAEPIPVEPAVGGDLNWVWPSGGRVLAAYVEGGSKGVDIEGRIGEPVLAAEAGKVTYAGSGIRGYGNLLIIQHASGLSSVYAHNSKLLAREGQQVARGQKIAELGKSDTDQAKLHFEIRRQGKPLDPLKLLPPR